MRAARPAIPMAPRGTTRFTSISASRESPLSPSGERVREGGAEEDNSPRLECVRRGAKDWEEGVGVGLGWALVDAGVAVFCRDDGGLGRGSWGGAGEQRAGWA